MTRALLLRAGAAAAGGGAGAGEPEGMAVGGSLQRRAVPADNSCLFNALAYVWQALSPHPFLAPVLSRTVVYQAFTVPGYFSELFAAWYF